MRVTIDDVIRFMAEANIRSIIRSGIPAEITNDTIQYRNSDGSLSNDFIVTETFGAETRATLGQKTTRSIHFLA